MITHYIKMQVKSAMNYDAVLLTFFLECQGIPLMFSVHSSLKLALGSLFLLETKWNPQKCPHLFLHAIINSS